MNNDINLTQPKMYNISAVILIKDEGPYIKEWLDYHILIGIEHFYIYDNESSDNTVATLEPYIERGLVSYEVVEGDFTWQSSCSSWRLGAINKYRSQSDWMVFLDADEFLRITDEETSLNNILRNLKQEDIFSLHLKVINFGTNWKVEEKLSIPVIHRYIRRYAVCYTVKPLVRSEIIDGIINGHMFHLKEGFKTISLVHQGPLPSNAANTGPAGADSIAKILSSEPLVINHYFTKSVQEYTTRKNKYKDCTFAVNRYSVTYLDSQAPVMNSVVDESLRKFAPLLGSDKIWDLLPLITDHWNSDSPASPYLDLLYASSAQIRAYIKKHDPDISRYKKFKNINTEQGDSTPGPISKSKRPDLVKFAHHLMTGDPVQQNPATLSGLIKKTTEYLSCKTCGHFNSLQEMIIEDDNE